MSNGLCDPNRNDALVFRYLGCRGCEFFSPDEWKMNLLTAVRSVTNTYKPLINNSSQSRVQVLTLWSSVKEPPFTRVFGGRRRQRAGRIDANQTPVQVEQDYLLWSWSIKNKWVNKLHREREREKACSIYTFINMYASTTFFFFLILPLVKSF